MCVSDQNWTQTQFAFGLVVYTAEVEYPIEPLPGVAVPCCVHGHCNSSHTVRFEHV